MTGKYHFIGIGGIGMSGIAQLLLERNLLVSGSDLVTSSITKRLKEMGADLFLGQSPENISPNMNVIFSSDIKETNPEFQAAVTLKCKMMHRSEMLMELMKGYDTLAVSGTHGKTTTSSLLSWVCHVGELNPTFCIGGILPQFNSNAKQGTSQLFIAEADESDGTFLNYQPFGGVVTNIGLDHMNYYKTEANLIDSFNKFMNLFQRHDFLFWSGDDERLLTLAHPGISYGFSSHCHLRCSNARQNGWASFFDISFENKMYHDVEVSLVGTHNVLNATAVFGLALRLGISEEKIRQALKSFGGVARRCEKKGEAKSILFLDDYAHHPTEIETTLKGVRAALPKRRLIAVFQPHRFTRTQDCLGKYASIFNAVDQLIVTDIYASGETPIPGLTAINVLNEIREFSTIPSEYISRENLAEQIVNCARPQDVFITLGAGNITNVSYEALRLLEKS